MTQPTLNTARLIVRPFTLDDAPAVQRLAGAPEVAAMTATIPHPYPDGAAEAWIATHRSRFEAGRELICAITLRATGELVGACELSINLAQRRGSLGYWIGVPYWGNGYCTEAAAELVRHGFEVVGLDRIHAEHFATNPASGRVMQKLGMRTEGTLRRHLLKDSKRLDVVLYGLLREERA